jgi:hypothetical protein
VTGGVTAVGQEELTFMTVSKDLWDTKVSGKAPKGKASWPFSLTLPSEAIAGDKPKARAQPYRLPPTFSGKLSHQSTSNLAYDIHAPERASPVYVDYKLVVTIRRGAFKVNQLYVIHLSREVLRAPADLLAPCSRTTA